MSESEIMHPDTDLLLGYLDRELSQPTRAEVSEHLSGCWRCREELASFEAALSEFARYREKAILPLVTVPDMPWPGLRAAMEEYDRTHPLLRVPSPLPSWRLARLALATLVLACVAAAVVLTVRWTHQREPMPVTPAPSAPVRPIMPQTPILAPPRLERHATLPEPSRADSEVLVWASLHQVGADLGEPIEVKRLADGKLEVMGRSIPAARRAEIASALSTLPEVRLEFADSTVTLPWREGAAGTGAGPRTFDARLLRRLGNTAAVDRLANQALDASEAMMARIYAMRNLRERFPATRRAAFQHGEAAILDRILADNRAQAVERASAVVALLESARDALGLPPAAAPRGNSALPEAAERMDRLLSVVFGGAATPDAPERVLMDLASALADLKAAIGRTE